MKKNSLVYNTNGFLTWIQIGIGVSIVVAVYLLMLYLDEEGFFSALSEDILDFTSIISDGDDFGEWLGGGIAGIIVGLLKALFEWGEEIGEDIF